MLRFITLTLGKFAMEGTQSTQRDTQHLAKKYQQILESRDAKAKHIKSFKRASKETGENTCEDVAIVGAGMAGLYSALALKREYPQLRVKIFEANDRVGGRVYTHRFSDEPFQYFEAGAMHYSDAESQKPVQQLIDHLNTEQPDFRLNVIPSFKSHPSGNRVFVNHTKQADGRIMTLEYANKHLDELGFPKEAEATEEAGKLLYNALGPVIDLLDNYDDQLQRGSYKDELDKYEEMSLNNYLSHDIIYHDVEDCERCKLKWPPQKINYVEVMSAQTNKFQHGLVDETILAADFLGSEKINWYTIEGGMSRLPEAMAKYFGEENIILQAVVNKVKELENGRVQIGYSDKDSKLHDEDFDAVILALPPSAVRMIPEKPVWPVDLEHGLRSIHFQPLYKLGLRFKSRFWEREDLRPSLGGISITDLPSRWVVHPSYGIGDKGMGVLVTYCCMTDTNHWLPKSKREKVKLALQDLDALYPEVKIFEEYAGWKPDSDNSSSDPSEHPAFLDESFIAQWGMEPWSVGDASFYPGQFSSLWSIMNKSRGNVYFTGEHLSTLHGWIAGAIDSALQTVGLLEDEQNLIA